MGPGNSYLTCAIFVIFFTFCKAENQSNLTDDSTSKETNSVESSTEIHCRSDIRLHKISYHWTVNHFNLRRPEGEGGNSIISPTFSSSTNDKFKWYLEILPGNETTEEISFHVYFSPESTEPKARAKFSVSFLDDEGNLIIGFGDDSFYAFDHHGDFWGWDEIQVDEVVLPDKRLKMIFNITYCENINTISYRNRTDATSNPDCDLCQDFNPLIANSNHSDVILKLEKNGKEYPAHKVVLAARSPVFASIFKQYKKLTTVAVTDVEEPVFEEVLKYIYTDKCENIEKFAEGILLAARKFGLDRLESICVDKMSENLTVENVINTLILADAYAVGQLKSNAIRFIANNYVAVSNTTTWENMVETNSKFVHEVCQSVIKFLGKMEK